MTVVDVASDGGPEGNRGIRIHRLHTVNGLTFDVPAHGVLCVVGGNNVGKSQFLREISSLILSPDGATRILLQDVDFSFEFERGDLQAWLDEHGQLIQDPTQGPTYRPRSLEGGQAFSTSVIQSWIGARPNPYLQNLAEWFIRNLDAGRRSSLAVGGLGMIGMGGAQGGPLYSLWRDGAQEIAFSAICERTFGFPLTLDRVSGSVQLRVGTPGVPSPLLQNPTVEYADAVAALKPLAEQGDGVKNYLGMVLHLMAADEGITVIDEPEAFLHPAQARSLGRHLGQQASLRKRQLLTATHDRDFVLGLLETDCPVTFIRINRAGNINSFASLHADRVKDIWSKPALRYSNLLQGLFHRAVIVCEGDPDCRWYAAVLDKIAMAGDFAAEEALFVPAGGKSQVPNFLEALDDLEIAAFGLLDFDAIYDVEFVERLTASRSIEPERILQLSRALASQLNSKDARKRAKEGGLKGLPAGTSVSMAKEMLGLLAAHRILVLPVGQLESFDNEIGNHGAAWVTAALEKGLHLESTATEELLQPVIDTLRQRWGAAEPRS